MSATEPATPTPPRTFDDVINDLDDCLSQIKEAADVVLEAAIGADIPNELFRRLSFGAQAIEDYAVKAGGFSDEAFTLAKKAAAILKDG